MLCLVPQTPQNVTFSTPRLGYSLGYIRRVTKGLRSTPSLLCPPLSRETSEKKRWQQGEIHFVAFRLIAFCNVVRDGFKHHHDCATALVCLHFFLHEDFKIAPSFEYNDGANDSGRDFAVFRSGFSGKQRRCHFWRVQDRRNFCACLSKCYSCYSAGPTAKSQSTDLRKGHDGPHFRRLNRSWLRRVLSQRKMRSRSMVVFEIRLERSS